MKRLNWPVGAEGIRPSYSPDACFYCKAAKGARHNAGCPVRSRTVVVRATIEYVVQVPEHWSPEDIMFHRNDGSWCSGNILSELEALDERAGCLCNHVSTEFVREATSEDETNDKLFVEALPS